MMLTMSDEPALQQWCSYMGCDIAPDDQTFVLP